MVCGVDCDVAFVAVGCVGVVALAFHFPPLRLWLVPLMSWSGTVMSLSQLTYCPQVCECCPGLVLAWQLCSVFPAHIVS